MYGDTTVIRRLAGQMDERAVDLRAQTRGLLGAAEQTTWKSTAGSAMRKRVAERASGIEEVARSYEDAAAKLRHHADEVDRLKELIENIARTVGHLISGAIDRLKDAGHAIIDGAIDGAKKLGHLMGIGGDDSPDPHDVALASFDQPPPGDMAWLDVPDVLGVSY